MRINWFKDENHLVYINGATQLAELERTLHFPGLEEAANELRQHPTAEGFTIKGPKRTSGRLFVPDLTFGEHIEMGENIFFYMGGDAGVLRHLLAGRAGGEMTESAAMP